eukprot:SAG31_NODE_2049_length_6564_cov_13.995824_1_plen_47_part_00
MATALDDEQEGMAIKENFLAFMEREVRSAPPFAVDLRHRLRRGAGA